MSAKRRSTGFTLLELMTAVTILGILLAIGVPSFTETMNANRLTSNTNAMVTALTVARSEASKRGIAVTVCASNLLQTACSGSASWNDGWIVFTDDIGTAGTVDGGDEVLQAFPAPVTGFTVTATGPTTMTYIRFLRSGSPDTAILSRTLKLSRPSCTGVHARQVSVSNTGRISSEKFAC
jgi:type IV fimbrial biogenesis protein FimT